jgi:outer membrane biosynthesis protein TonB
MPFLKGGAGGALAAFIGASGTMGSPHLCARPPPININGPLLFCVDSALYLFGRKLEEAQSQTKKKKTKKNQTKKKKKKKKKKKPKKTKKKKPKKPKKPKKQQIPKIPKIKKKKKNRKKCGENCVHTE